MSSEQRYLTNTDQEYNAERNVPDSTELVTASRSFGVQETMERDTLVTIAVDCQTDGTTDGSVNLDSSALDSAVAIVTTHAALGANAEKARIVTLFVPEGGTYVVLNTSDPAGANSLLSVTETYF